MYKNIGGKIKGLAVFFCVIGILTSIVIGVLAMVGASEFSYFDDSVAVMGVFGGLLTIIVGSLISWVSSFLLYGFGQLVQNSDRIYRELKKSPDGTYYGKMNIPGTFAGTSQFASNVPFGNANVGANNGANGYYNAPVNGETPAQYAPQNNTYSADGNSYQPQANSEIGATTVL